MLRTHYENKPLHTMSASQVLRLINHYKKEISIGLIWLFVISALIGMKLGYTDWFLPKTPINLLLAAILLIWNFGLFRWKEIGIWLAAFAIGMVSEILGVQTGVIFGEYYYGENLGPKLWGVPYLIGVNWAVLAFITAAISRKIIKGKLGRLFVGAFLMVALDVVLELLAGPFDFWYFAGGVAPFKNYIAWMLIAFGLQWMIQGSVRIRDYTYSAHLYATQFCFFGASYAFIF